MTVNSDFRDLFAAFNDESVDYLVVGAHAVMFYTEPRYTKDLDIWVRPSPENAQRVLRALAKFGAPLEGLVVDDFATDGTIFQIGIEPNRIDVITSIDGVTYDEATLTSTASTYGGIPIRLLGLATLITNKKAAGRAQDLLDVEKLEKVKA